MSDTDAGTMKWALALCWLITNLIRRYKCKSSQCSFFKLPPSHTLLLSQVGMSATLLYAYLTWYPLMCPDFLIYVFIANICHGYILMCYIAYWADIAKPFAHVARKGHAKKKAVRDWLQSYCTNTFLTFLGPCCWRGLILNPTGKSSEE